jgi:hypothetical protein
LAQGQNAVSTVPALVWTYPALARERLLAAITGGELHLGLLPPRLLTEHDDGAEKEEKLSHEGEGECYA